MFDLSMTKILILAVIAVVVFGPDQLPKIAAQAGRTLRELRRIADGAKDDLRQGLGPEFDDFNISDLNPRHFVQRHLLDALDGDAQEPPAAAGAAAPAAADRAQPPPYDNEAT